MTNRTANQQGELIRAARRRQALTQRELAERADLTQVTIARAETGKRQPSLRTVRKIAKALGVPPSDLMVDDTSKAEVAPVWPWKRSSTT